jgi:hypothetical protein
MRTVVGWDGWIQIHLKPLAIVTMKNDEKCGFRSNVTGTLEIFGIYPRKRSEVTVKY